MRPGEKLLHTWERLKQLLQYASTTWALWPIAEVIFAADSSNNTKQTLNFVGTVFGASTLGRHKRDLPYPLVLEAAQSCEDRVEW